MELLHQFLDIVIHVDKHLDIVFQNYGAWSYAILFLIIFCETGLVITPFLPGDSLLFAAGALSSSTSLNVHFLALILCVAAVTGYTTNYAIGFFAGEKLIAAGWVNKQYIERTHRFFEKYGGKSMVLARYVPIIRTFPPFLAGIGKMDYKKFTLYNFVGGISWILIFTYAGYFFGGLPAVKNNFTLVIMAIIVISIMPAVIEIVRARRSSAT